MSSGAMPVAESVDARADVMIVPDRFFGEKETDCVVAGPRPSFHLATLLTFPSTTIEDSLQVVPLPGAGYVVAKRSLDILVAIVALVCLTPLFILVTLAIVVTSPGSILFSQQRCGRGGQPFRLLKFRTMVTDAERIRHELAHLNEMSGPMFKLRTDPRVTGVGRVLRKFSVDELPQLLNVLWGDMTLVGPRPSIVAEVDAFTDHQRRRLDVKPGLTCLWQVSGRSDLSFDEWVELDVEYIRTQSFWLDIRILGRTIPAVLSGRGAY